MRAIPVSAISLKTISLFENFDEKHRADLAKNCRGQVFENREVILSVNSSNRDVYFILSGMVHIANFSPDGREVTFRDQGPGAAFGILSAIDDMPRSAHAISRDTTTIARMSGEQFNKLLVDYPAVNANVMQYIVSLVRTLSARVIEFSTMTVNQRLYAELLRLSEFSETIEDLAEIRQMPTHADLASRIATHREAVSRELSLLCNAGLLSKCGSKVSITKVSALRKRLPHTNTEIDRRRVH